MKNIEKELHRIVKECKASKDVQAAEQAFKEVSIKIKEAIKSIKKDEKHGAMWKVHQNTLNRKLREAREQVADICHSHEFKSVKIQSKSNKVNCEVKI